MVSVMKICIVASLTFALFLSAALPAFAQKKKSDLEKPMAGPRATALRVTPLYISPDPSSKKSIACRLAAKW